MTALFAEPQYPAKSAETIARETGAKVYTLDPCVSGLPEADAYLWVQNTNLAVLLGALGGKQELTAERQNGKTEE